MLRGILQKPEGREANINSENRANGQKWNVSSCSEVFPDGHSVCLEGGRVAERKYKSKKKGEAKLSGRKITGSHASLNQMFDDLILSDRSSVNTSWSDPTSRVPYRL